jgi:voltage-gated potassium channel
VEIELRPDHVVRLGAGQFFGERALLKNTKRSATVTACTRSRLRVLGAIDLKTPIAREPHIADHIDRIASKRTDHGAGTANTG